MVEHFFQCPYCWEHISMLLDTSITSTTYIEDCEVCCRPIQVTFTCTDNDVTSFSADDIDQ